MASHVKIFRDIVTDQVTTRVAIEARAGHPQGLTNRTFESITGALMMANWDELSKLTIAQCVNRLCGTESKPPKGRKHKASGRRIK